MGLFVKTWNFQFYFGSSRTGCNAWIGFIIYCGVGATFGFRVGIVYVAGVILGANVVSLLAVSGLFDFIVAFPKINF